MLAWRERVDHAIGRDREQRIDTRCKGKQTFVPGATFGSKPDGFFELTVQRMEAKVPEPEHEVHQAASMSASNGKRRYRHGVATRHRRL